jgi:sugar/nucleoside kinase (ribokinase family)
MKEGDPQKTAEPAGADAANPAVPTLPILVVGSVALDTITTPHGQVRDVLGGSAAYFSLVASLLAPVRVVAVVGEDFPERYREALGRRDVDLSGLVTQPGKTFRWEGIYEADLVRRRTIRTDLNVFETFRPTIPSSFAATPVVFLANIDPDLQASVLDQMESPRWVFLDTMNFWLHGAKRDSLVRLLSRVHAVLVDHEEARLLSGQQRLADAARWIADHGPLMVVVKRGDCGALVRLGNDWFWVSPYPEAEVMDATGAGDSFAGGVLGAIARWGEDGGGLRRALVVGAAAASRAIEVFGAQDLVNLDLAGVLDRARVIRGMGQVPQPDPALDGVPVATVTRPKGGSTGGSRKG